jgi:hypothetical protein
MDVGEMTARMAEIVRQILDRQRMEQLVKDNERLRSGLLSVCLASEDLRVRTQRLVSLARER